MVLDAPDHGPLALDDRPGVDGDRDADDREQDDRPALARRRDRVADRLGAPAALDRDVGPEAAGQSAHRVEPRGFAAVDRGVRPEPPPELEPGGTMPQEDRGRRAGRAGDLERDEADRAVADDRDRIAEADAGRPDGPDGNLGGLDERGLVVADRIGEPDARPSRNPDVLGQAAVAVEADRGPRDAQRVLVPAAVPALAAEEADLRCHAIADGEPLDARPDRHDLARELVAERHRRLLAGQRIRVVDGDDDGAVAVLLEIGPADAAPAHPEQDLAMTDGRDGDLVDPDVAATVPPCSSHRAGHPAVPSSRCASVTDPASITGVLLVVCGNPEAASSPVRAVDVASRAIGPCCTRPAGASGDPAGTRYSWWPQGWRTPGG